MSWPHRLGLQERCCYERGNMFSHVPPADLYLMKMILHDWDDDECIRILSNIRKASNDKSKILIIEHIVPEANIPHFSKLFDVHMMCATTGRERTKEEYEFLLSQSGWIFARLYYPQNGSIGIIEGLKSN
jgi:hypothetical protein